MRRHIPVLALDLGLVGAACSSEPGTSVDSGDGGSDGVEAGPPLMEKQSFTVAATVSFRHRDRVRHR
jgi:hypothetical protein